VPDGKTHTTASVVLSLLSSIAMLAYGVPAKYIAYTAAGCLTSIVLSPDLDIDAGYIGGALVRKYFGGVLGWMWKTVWSPYSKIVKHRSVISHFPVIGTFIRLFYLYFWYQAITLTINVALFFVSQGWSLPVYQVAWKEVLSAAWGTTPWTVASTNAFSYLLGLCASDTLHGTMDITSTFIKTTRRKIFGNLHFPMSEMQKGSRGRASHRPTSYRNPQGLQG